MKQLIILATVILCSCSAGKSRSPIVVIPTQYIYSEQNSSTLEVINARWWENFGDTTLNSLIEHALENNRNLAIAASRIEQARFNIGLVRSEFLPAFGIMASGEGDYTPQTKILQEYMVKPTVSWDISLFGAMKNSSDAARSQLLSTEYGYRMVMLSLTAEVATTYFTLVQYQRSLDISIRSYNLRRESTNMIDSMVRYGMSSAVDLEQARSLTSTAAVNIPQYRRAVAQTAIVLNILLGDTPSTLPQSDLLQVDNPVVCTPNPFLIPTGLPSELLDRRPDVMQSYYDYLAASANVGIAKAARYPSITLTGEGGVLSTALNSLFTGNPLAWTGMLSVTEPLFAFGRNKRNLQIAIEKQNQASLSYEQMVLTAFGDVEKSLIAISTYRQQVEAYCELLRTNNATKMMTGELYKNGLTNYLEVLDAERTLYASQLMYVAILSEQYSNYVSLYKALGGGW